MSARSTDTTRLPGAQTETTASPAGRATSAAPLAWATCSDTVRPTSALGVTSAREVQRRARRAQQARTPTTRLDSRLPAWTSAQPVRSTTTARGPQLLRCSVRLGPTAHRMRRVFSREEEGTLSCVRQANTAEQPAQHRQAGSSEGPARLVPTALAAQLTRFRAPPTKARCARRASPLRSTQPPALTAACLARTSDTADATHAKLGSSALAVPRRGSRSTLPWKEASSARLAITARLDLRRPAPALSVAIGSRSKVNQWKIATDVQRGLSTIWWASQAALAAAEEPPAWKIAPAAPALERTGRGELRRGLAYASLGSESPTSPRPHRPPPSEATAFLCWTRSVQPGRTRASTATASLTLSAPKPRCAAEQEQWKATTTAPWAPASA